MSATPYVWAPNAPTGFTVTTTPIKIAVLKNTESTALYISNLGSSTVFLSLDAPNATEGSAAVDKGIAVFPNTTFNFNGCGLPFESSVWAVASSSCKISVQG